jgi:hypothetical protein
MEPHEESAEPARSLATPSLYPGYCASLHLQLLAEPRHGCQLCRALMAERRVANFPWRPVTTIT